MRDFFPVRNEVGYHTAMELSFVRGAFLEPGPAMVWMRPRVPLVAGEETSPLERLLIAADAGNGVSAALDWRRYLFINTDLSVHLKRLPEGDWVGLDAVTYPEPHGIGLADTVLWDERGRLGRGAQTLVVRSPLSERRRRAAYPPSACRHDRRDHGGHRRSRTDHRLLHRHRTGHGRAARAGRATPSTPPRAGSSRSRTCARAAAGRWRST